jgi:hypothetical protein
MLNFMRRSGLPTQTKLEDGVMEMRVNLT